MNWYATRLNSVWHVVNAITEETIETFHETVSKQMATRLNIRDMADYASIGELDWRGVVSANKYKHAILPSPLRLFDKSRTLCDRPTSGIVDFTSKLELCPVCLNEVLALNDGFVPAYDPFCTKWQEGKYELAMLYIRFNNSDYEQYLKVRA